MDKNEMDKNEFLQLQKKIDEENKIQRESRKWAFEEFGKRTANGNSLWPSQREAFTAGVMTGELRRVGKISELEEQIRQQQQTIERLKRNWEIDLKEYREDLEKTLTHKPGGEMSDKERGLFHKYNVTRTDGKPVNWAFVLEDKDPLAIPALQAYESAARQKGYIALAEDLRLQIAMMKAKIR